MVHAASVMVALVAVIRIFASLICLTPLAVMDLRRLTEVTYNAGGERALLSSALSHDR